ncbi:MAG: transcription antitermination factor NusB [Verrucomicrobia bacterium]|nr:transcription antitermination factor NusB [Verrucomicrobiota bacterium]MCF7709349.1 transcription antitermination factor NusB [Verrucomicrobiota bacterium]
MGKRRLARERAVQFLFQYDFNPQKDCETEFYRFWETQRRNEIIESRNTATWGQTIELPPPTPEEERLRDFSRSLTLGAIEHLPEIDEEIRKYSKNWELHRIATVDRNILRLAIYEMKFRDDIPPVVSINEAVDIAKRYSTDESGKFVNGILDQVRKELLRPARTAIEKNQS